MKISPILFVFILNGCVTSSVPTVYKAETNSSIEKQLDLAGLNFVKDISSFQFDTAIRLLSYLHANMEADIEHEDAFFLELNSLRLSRKELTNHLDSLVSENSDNELAYLARGVYLIGKAQSARGDDVISETSASQFEEMQRIHKLASEDLFRVLEISDSSFVAHLMLGSIFSMYSDLSIMERKHFNEALRIQPNSYWVWQELLFRSKPRWGGSYELMELRINEMKGYYKNNPKLRVLEGSILEDKGSVAQLNKQYSLAKSTYEEALAFGDNHRVLIGLGWVNNKLGMYEEGCDQIQKAVRLRPYVPRYNINMLLL